MPRVLIKKRDYLITDFARWLVGKMREKRLYQADIGEILGVSQQSVSRRISEGIEEKDVFRQGEMITLFKELEATDEEILRLMKL